MNTSIIGVLLSRALSACAYYSLFPYLLAILTKQFALNVWQSGIVIAVVVVMSRLLAMPGGRAVDRWGAVRPIFVSNVVSCLAIAALIATPRESTLLVIVLLVLRGAMAAGQNVAYRVATRDNADSALLVRAYSHLGIASNIGVIVGPVLGSLSESAGYNALLAPLLFHMAAIASGLTIKSSNREMAEQTAAPVAQHARKHGLGAVFIAAYLTQWVLVQQITLALAYYCEFHLKKASLSGAFFAIQGALIVPTMFLVGKRFGSIWPRNQVLLFIVGALVMCLSFLLFGAIGASWPLLAVVAFAVVLTIAEAISVPVGDAHIASSANKQYLGAAFSVTSLLQAIGMAIGSASGAALIWLLDQRASLGIFWQVFGVLGLVAYVPLLLLSQRERKLQALEPGPA